MTLWRWLEEPIPTAQFYFWGFWVLLVLLGLPLIVRLIV